MQSLELADNIDDRTETPLIVFTQAAAKPKKVQSSKCWDTEVAAAQFLMVHL